MKWSLFTFSTAVSYNLTSDDLWPWCVTFDLVNKWGFPCCIYDPTLVEIHQSMWKLESNVNLVSQQTTTSTDNNSGKSDPFPAKAGDTKIEGTFCSSACLRDICFHLFHFFSETSKLAYSSTICRDQGRLAGFYNVHYLFIVANFITISVEKNQGRKTAFGLALKYQRDRVILFSMCYYSRAWNVSIWSAFPDEIKDNK